MTTVSFDAVAGVALVAGFPRYSSANHDLAIAVAIAAAESGRNTSVIAYGDPRYCNGAEDCGKHYVSNYAGGVCLGGCQCEDSIGLWQINACQNEGKDLVTPYPAILTNPFANGIVAHSLYASGRYFNPWTTYRFGQYKAHMAEATASAQRATAVLAQSGQAALQTWTQKALIASGVGGGPVPVGTGDTTSGGTTADPADWGSLLTDLFSGNPIQILGALAGILGGGENPLTNLYHMAIAILTIGTRILAFLVNPDNWKRIGYVALGGMLIVIAVALAIKEAQGPVEKVAKPIIATLKEYGSAVAGAVA